jgi:hypothetical protein
VVVLLRRPNRSKPDERRDDPFWEFGSFGRTGCHKKNLMNPKRTGELVGTQFAFIQGGPLGYRLVHVTPPVSFRSVSSKVSEAVWHPPGMPLTYSTAPIVIANDGASDVPLLAALADGVRRPSPVSRFASAFRSRRTPLAGVVGEEVIATYKRFRKTADVSASYVDALPYAPALPEHQRSRRYEAVRRKVRRQG